MINVVHPAFEIMKDDLKDCSNMLILEKIIRTCYRSEGNISEYSYKKLIKKILENEHTAMLEHMFISVKFFIDRGITHEFVRHRLCAFAQSSTRYIDYTSGLNVVKPAHITMTEIEEISDVSMKDYPYFISQVSDENKQKIEEAFLFLNSCRTSFLNYLARIKNGANRSQARGSLCHHTEAELVVTANIREWLHIFSLRDSKAAHQDFRLVIAGFRNLLAEEYPLFFSKSESPNAIVQKIIGDSVKWEVMPEEEYNEGDFFETKRTITIPVN